MTDRYDAYRLKFDVVAWATADQRASALAARRFASIPGAQWEGDGWEALSENMIRVEVNKVAKGLERIGNDYRANRVTVDFRPVGDKASEETAETMDGLFRADVYRSKAGQAFDNAFDEGSSGGMGAFRLVNELEDELDPSNDYQRIAFKAIVDADQSVYFDPNSKLYDKSDAKWCVVITAMSPDAFREEYGEGRDVSWPESTFKYRYDWFTPEVVRVAEWYEVVERKEKLWIFHHVLSDDEERWWDSQITEEQRAALVAKGYDQTSQERKRRRVQKTVLSGAEELRAPKFIAGPNIPVIPFYYKRWYIDNIERFRGHTQIAMDPQRIYNTAVSKLVETDALAPREVPIVTPEQMLGHENDWARATIDRLPFLRLNAILDPDGRPLPAGPIATLQPPQLSPVKAALMQLMAADITEMTNSDDGADEVRSNVSAEAMDIAATRSDAFGFTGMDNFRQSMQRCGEVYQGMASEIYVEPGRVVPTLSDDGEEGEAVLGEAYTDERGRYLVRNDFSQGRYNVISDVTEATNTRRDKTVRSSLGIAEMAVKAGDTEMAQAALSTAVVNMDGDGLDDFKEFVRKRGLAIGLFKPTEEEEQAMAEAAQNQQPSAADQALAAQARELDASAGLKEAQAETTRADASLKKTSAILNLAKAEDLGMPKEGANDLDDIKTIADISHVQAQTRKIAAETDDIPARQDLERKKIAFGRDREDAA